MTRTRGDVEGGGVKAAKWANHPSQLWMYIQWSRAQYTFVVPGIALAIQPVRVGVKGSPLVLGKFVNDTPRTGQKWMAEAVVSCRSAGHT